MRDDLAKPLPVAVLLFGFALAGCSGDTPSGGSGMSGSAGNNSTTGGMSHVGGNGSGGNISAGSSNSSHGGSSSMAGTSSGGGNTGGKATGGSGGGNPPGGADCNAPGLTWKSANKTWYESYPDPGSEECVKYNGCTWAGEFSACDGKKPEAWVKEHNIVAAFPDFDTLQLHDLCLRSGNKTIVVTVLDTCGDSDCDGCCTQNQGDADQLIDLESSTNERWGIDDGRIEWADLGPTRGDGCD